MSLEDVYLASVGTRRDTTCPGHTPPQTRMVQPLGHMGHHYGQEGLGEPGPAHEVETLLAALVDAGRDLDSELVAQVRARLIPLGRQERAELVAVIDDAFEVAPDVGVARRQAHRLLGDPAAVESAKALWSAYLTSLPTEAKNLSEP